MVSTKEVYDVLVMVGYVVIWIHTMNDDCSEVKEHAGKLVWMWLEHIANHQVVKQISRIRKICGLQGLRPYRPGVMGVRSADHWGHNILTSISLDQSGSEYLFTGLCSLSRERKE